ncbi:hypothetical protein GCM10022224_004130 [Nonomuraea antimicrobica]|uniref:Uncharacterized protein n=1 Tax=Nonomuraea antimicrobica TaxID=561173 RepID=A0ABP7B1J3_9ACTN
MSRATSAAADGENAEAAAPWPSRAAHSQPGLSAIAYRAEAAANATRPPSRTGLAPIRSARPPNSGLSSTSAPSYRASSPPRTSSEVTASPEKAPRLAAMAWEPNAVVNPAA